MEATETKEAENGQPLVKYKPTDAEIAEMGEEIKSTLAVLEPGTPERYDALKAEISKVRTYRTDIERCRVAWKADSLAWGRRVDAEAKRLTGLILAIEDPMKREKEDIDSAKERAARAIVEAEAARVAEMERQLKEQQQAREKAAREEEAARLDGIRQQLAADRAALEAERKEQEAARKVIQDKLNAERKAEDDRRREEIRLINAENARIAAEQSKEREYLIEKQRVIAEAERKIAHAKEAEEMRLYKLHLEEEAKIEAARDAQAKAELAAVEAENRKKAEEAEAKRIEAAKPTVKKINEFGAVLRKLPIPVMKDGKAGEYCASFLSSLTKEINAWATQCEAFSIKKGG